MASFVTSSIFSTYRVYKSTMLTSIECHVPRHGCITFFSLFPNCAVHIYSCSFHKHVLNPHNQPPHPLLPPTTLTKHAPLPPPHPHILQPLQHNLRATIAIRVHPQHLAEQRFGRRMRGREGALQHVQVHRAVLVMRRLRRQAEVDQDDVAGEGGKCRWSGGGWRC